MKEGFYPALGTPTDSEGKLITNSFNKEIGQMLEAGASGVLCMGSMGKMATIRNTEYPKIAKQCVEAVSKRVPVMVGVMDCSVNRVLDRIDALDKMGIEGVVATAPYYSKVSDEGIKNFFTMLSKVSRYPVYIYDLPSVAQSSITGEVLNSLMKLPNIKGIKTANLNLILDLSRNNMPEGDFSIFYSGLDSFDAAIKLGIKRNLDGMFTCTPRNSKLMYENMKEPDREQISGCLNNILALRNLFLKENVFPAYSYAMELLGCTGNYHPDYDRQVSDKLKEEIYGCMKSIKEI